MSGQHANTGTRAGPGEAPVPGISSPLPGKLGESLPPDPTWQLAVDGGSGMRARVEESWLCVADGVMGTRGSVEEDGPESDPLVVAAGIFDRAGDRETLLEAPSWVTVEAGQVLPPSRWVLDLRDGLLRREAESEDGERVIRSGRFACLARPGVGVLVAEGANCGAHQNRRDGVGVGETPNETEAATVTTQAVERISTLGGGILALTRTRRRAAAVGSPTCLERIAAHGVAARRRPSHARAEAELDEAWGLSPAGLLAEQRRAWQSRWATADIEIVGDPELTRAVRFGLFHLMASVADHGTAAVGPRGLSGRAYAGHVLWDAEVFVLPFLAATHPAAARAMLKYRIRRLPAARRAAAAEGRSGARFPWESAADGTDVTPLAGMDVHGIHVPILTGRLEEHITADVAWAAWRLASWTGRWAFLDGPGRNLVVDTARYWASRVHTDASGTGHIDGVIGPDEYHEDVDDNAFTNNLAAWNLRRGADVVGRKPGPGEVDEADHWLKTADRLATGLDPATAVYEQFAGYHRLKPVLASSLGTVPFAGDLLLGRGRVARSQLIKQADVLMLHHMVPDAVAAGSLGPNLDYYLPRACHGSSLSPSIHAAVLARSGRAEEARALLELATRIDFDDLTDAAAGGLHLANLGGIWQALVHGFAGVRIAGPDDAALAVDPRLPGGWEELRIRLRWHGRTVALRCTQSSLYVGTDRPLTVEAGGVTVRVDPPGRWIP